MAEDCDSFASATTETLVFLYSTLMEAMEKRGIPVDALEKLTEEELKEMNNDNKTEPPPTATKSAKRGAERAGQSSSPELLMKQLTDINISQKGFMATKRELPFGKSRPTPSVSEIKAPTDGRCFYAKNKYGNFEGHKENVFIFGVKPSAKNGAQTHGLCAANELVKSITVGKDALLCILSDGTEVETITDFVQFYQCFSPAPALTIRSNNYGTMKDFYDTSENFALWVHDVSQVTLSGIFSAEHLIMLTKALEYVEIFQAFDLTITERSVTLNEWLKCLPFVSQITVDARGFYGSRYCSDFENAVDFLSKSREEHQSLTVITRGMIDPATLNAMIQNAENVISGKSTINFITEDPLYREINGLLFSELDYAMGATDVVMESYEKTIQATYYQVYDGCTLNFGFSKKTDADK